jgi:serine/threonine protein kinase
MCTIWQVVPVEEDFEIGAELGKGQFSRVCQCVNKRTLERKAVKIIEKETMDAEEKEVRSWYGARCTSNMGWCRCRQK